MTESRFGAILLAAGRGSRFDPEGRSNKLLASLPDGEAVVAASARTLLGAVDKVIAVTRPGDGEVALLLATMGCTVVVCPDAELGMGASLACGARYAHFHFPDIAGWLVALGDMPAVRPATLERLLSVLASGVECAAPRHDGQRGHPVAFVRARLPRLAELSGDTGGRAVAADAVAVLVDDPGVLRDIDVPEDINTVKIIPKSI